MAETAGLVIGGVGLVALFDSCMSAFEYVESGKKYGKDYQTAALKLSLLQLRLGRWEKSVQLQDGPAHVTGQMRVQVAAEDDVESVKGLLGSIYAGFESAEAASKKYKPTDDPGSGNNSVEALIARVHGMALSRQKSASLGQKARWALHDKKKFKTLITNLDDQIGDLVSLFPAVKEQQVVLARREAQELVQPAGIEEPKVAFKALDEAGEEVDPSLKSALDTIAREKSGHSFLHIVNEGGAKLLAGDNIDSSFPGNTSFGTRLSFGEARNSGPSRAHLGNNYGGKYVLDD